MLRPNRLTPLILVLALAGCADTIAPVIAGIETSEIEQSLRRGGGDGPEHHVLRQDGAAPALEQYTASFWAVKGRDRTLEIWYQDYERGIDDYGAYKQANRFFQFEVPKQGLEASPTGVQYAKGDSVLITVTVHPHNFQVEFQPSGLIFSKQHPANLKIWYGLADHDLDRDGDFDAEDERLLRKLSFFHFESPLSQWDRVRSKNDTVEKTVVAEIGSFSGYAISW